MNNNRFRILLLIQALCLIILTLVIGGIILYYLDRRDIPHNINLLTERVEVLERDNIKLINSLESINNSLEELKAIPQPKDGEDGKDGSHGSDGNDGEDSLSTHTIERTQIIEQVPVNGIDGLTPDIRCNEERNRWEIRYFTTDTYRALQGKSTKCTIES